MWWWTPARAWRRKRSAPGSVSRANGHRSSVGVGAAALVVEGVLRCRAAVDAGRHVAIGRGTDPAVLLGVFEDRRWPGWLLALRPDSGLAQHLGAVARVLQLRPRHRPQD